MIRTDLRKKLPLSILTGIICTVPSLGIAQSAVPASKIDTGDTAWILVSTALVMLMTPGPCLVLWRHGAAEERARHHHAQLHRHRARERPVDTVRLLAGLRPGRQGIIGSLSWAGLQGVGAAPNADYAATVPHMAFMVYQMMFAVITPALISGAFAERMKFSAYLVFALAWTTLVYDPVAHWVWGRGRMDEAPRRARFRRRHRGACDLGVLGARRRAVYRQAQRFPARAHAAP